MEGYMMNELTDLTMTRNLTIKLQEIILSKINTSIEKLNFLNSKEVLKNDINTILYELKDGLFISDLKKVVESLIFFVNTKDDYAVEEVIKALIIIRDGINAKSEKLVRITN
jgi:hypothetical protein